VRKHPYGCLINFYGGKSKIASKYPVPKYDTIIEPFAGGAAYSLYHCERQVVLNELDARTVAIWQVMTGLPIEEILRHIPELAIAGDKVTDFLTPETPYGVEQILRSCANTGAFGDKTTYNTITPFGEKNWWNDAIRRRLQYWHPKIQHWNVVHGDYMEIPDVEATWFIDPPYWGGAPGRKGSDYLHWQINYEELAEWCKSRRGQVIVCEQSGASWLPFEHLVEMSISNVFGHARTKEVMWHRD
jgi:site-specific DNA-adenine methylase